MLPELIDYETNIPTQNNKLKQNTDCPVPANAALSGRPRCVKTQRGSYRQRQRSPGHQSQPRDDPSQRGKRQKRYAMVMQTRYSMRVPRSPRRTARVCLPALRSFSISRKLLTTRMAAMINPTGTDIHHAETLTDRLNKIRSSHSRKPKKIKTKISPRP